MKKIILLLFLYLALLPSTVNAQETTKFVPKIVISNITSASFTVSWFGDGKADQAIIYGRAEPLSIWSLDDRGGFVERSTHHVTLRNLQPDTEYLFRINNEGQTYRQKTAKQIISNPPIPYRFKGNVYTENDQLAPQEGIVYMRATGANLLSSVIASDGTWGINTQLMRKADLSAYQEIRGTEYVNFFARAGFEGEATAKLYGYAFEHPINLNLSEVRLPFYKIILPGLLENSAPQTVAPEQNPPTNQQPQTASSDNFFGTLWQRLGDLF